MHWKIKATIQRMVAWLPESASYGLYYRLQRAAGGLRRVDPTPRLSAGVDAWRRLVAAGADPVGKTFFEVGTGRVVSVPLAYWLMGAGRIVTVDLNPYLKAELVRDSVEYIAANRAAVAELFGELLVAERFERLLGFASASRFDLDAFLETVEIEYHAPSDAAATGLPAGSIDFHTSISVMEHIPPEVLAAILAEGRRLLRPDGFSIHCIDYSDHFAHRDPSITPVNFLRFSQAEWDRWAGNRYMYMNRLRHRDYQTLFHGAAFEIEAEETVTNDRSLAALRSGEVQPHANYDGIAAEELAITSAWIVGRPLAATRAGAA